MKCSQCDAEIVAGSGFCHHCGAAVNADPGDSRLEPPAGHSSLLTAARPQPDPADEPPATSATPAGPRGRSIDDPERELWTARYSPKAMIGAWTVAGIISIAAIVVGVMYESINWWHVLILLVLLWGGIQLRLWYKQLGAKYKLTTQRFVHETGIISHTINRIELIDIEDVQMQRGPIERLVGIGTIKMITGDVTDANLTICGLDNVQHRFEELEKALRAEKRRRELRLERT